MSKHKGKTEMKRMAACLFAVVALNDVKVTGGFWLPCFEANRLVIVKTDFRND